jgi:hypothetical protein
MTHGTAVALLAVPALVAIAAGVVLLRRAFSRRELLPEEVALAFAWVFVVGSLVWLEAFLTGSTLLGFPDPFTWLAASHFAAAGFGALTVTALVCRVVSSARGIIALRVLLLAHPLAYLVTAAGIAGAPHCNQLGAASYQLIFVAQLAAVLLGKPNRIARGPRLLLLISLCVPVATLVLAVAWAWGRPVFDLMGMVRYHGLVNAIGHVGLAFVALGWGRPRAHSPLRTALRRAARKTHQVPVFSFHLVRTTLVATAKTLLRPPTSERVPGLLHAECMTVMELGAPILSGGRTQFRQLAVFASWDDERAIDAFLTNTELGRALSAGWHVRLEFLRRWGRVSGFDDLPATTGETDPSAPVVAVTLARMRLFQVPRFIRWGKPVEILVRDHPSTTLALAAMRMPNTVSTLSIWRSEREMTDMVRGRGGAPGADRHAVAEAERRRKDFHHEFTTLRFRALSERGEWQGRERIVPMPEAESS